MPPKCQSQWPSSLPRRPAVARLLRLWFESHREHGLGGGGTHRCLSVVCFKVRGLCDELITCPEESYRLWCVVMCDLQTSRIRRPWPEFGCRATKKISELYELCHKLMSVLLNIEYFIIWLLVYINYASDGLLTHSDKLQRII